MIELSVIVLNCMPLRELAMGKNLKTESVKVD